MKTFDNSLLRAFADWLAGRGYEKMDGPVVKTGYRRWIPLAVWLVLGYLVMPLVIFDFTSTAVPWDEETFDGKKVAIGPTPRGWVPGAAHGWDIPGGADYSEDAWPFVLWKPLCVLYCKAKGHALPARWRW